MTLCIAMTNYEVLRSVFFLDFTWDSLHIVYVVLSFAPNKELLKSLARGTIIIDEAHSAQSRLGTVKSFLTKTYNYLGFYEIRYALVLITVIGVLRMNLSITENPVDPVEDLLKRHPEYDRTRVEWLQEERRKPYGE